MATNRLKRRDSPCLATNPPFTKRAASLCPSSLRHPRPRELNTLGRRSAFKSAAHHEFSQRPTSNPESRFDLSEGKTRLIRSSGGFESTFRDERNVPLFRRDVFQCRDGLIPFYDQMRQRTSQEFSIRSPVRNLQLLANLTARTSSAVRTYATAHSTRKQKPFDMPQNAIRFLGLRKRCVYRFVFPDDRNIAFAIEKTSYV